MASSPYRGPTPTLEDDEPIPEFHDYPDPSLRNCAVKAAIAIVGGAVLFGLGQEVYAVALAPALLTEAAIFSLKHLLAARARRRVAAVGDELADAASRASERGTR